MAWNKVHGAQGAGSVTFLVDSKEVDLMFDRAIMATSPLALAGFLRTYIDPFLRQRAGTRFQQEGDDASGSWLPLMESTQEIRSNEGYAPSHPINVRTGELEDYIVNHAGSIVGTATGAVLTLPGDPASGELADKISTAQMGREDPYTVPRPVLALAAADLEYTLVSLGEFIIDMARV